jgi:RNA polymerase sigma-70 factor (ECF subfamily)
LTTTRAIPHFSDDLAKTEDFEAIVRLYRRKIFRFVLASLRDQDLAETITQDCFMKAYRGLGRFRQDCSLDTWLMQIAANLVKDYARNRRLRFWRRAEQAAKPAEKLSDLLDSGDISAEAQALWKERIDAVWTAAEQLPERQRTVFLLRFVEDLDILEIAAVCRMKEGTVKRHLFRALQAVRERMGERD